VSVGSQRAESLGLVLQVISSNALAGTERHVVGLTRELRALGCDVRVVCSPFADVLRDHARLQGIPADPVNRVALGQVSLVHAHDGRAAMIAPLLARRSRALLVRTQHFVQPASAGRSGFVGYTSRRAHRMLNHRLDGYIAVSEAARSAAIERNETADAAVAVIPPGIRLPDVEALAVAQSRRVQASELVVVSAGRIEHERRFDVLLRAIPGVLEQFPTCRFVLAGSGSAEEELRGLASRLAIAHAITWTGWLGEIEEVLSGAHVYVNTWPYEGFGMATAEAMAWAMPVIVTTSGASAELVNNGRAGVAIEPGEPGQLAVAICRILGDHRLAAQIGERAREHAQRYSIRATATATLDFYQRIRASRGGG